MRLDKNYQEVLQELETNEDSGLTTANAKERYEKYGANALKEKKHTPFFVKFLLQFKDFLVIILLIAAVVSVLVDRSEWIESVIILIVVLLNSLLGAIQESKAEKSLDALKKLSTPNAKVIRDNIVMVIPSSELVPGDIILIEAGDFIPADARLIEATNLLVDESALTGESVPVQKNNNTLEKNDVSIGDMTNMIFSSTYVTYGKGKAVVVKTGMATEIGKIAEVLMNHDESATPLQNRLDQIGKTIGIICIIVCVVVLAMELISGTSFIEAFKVAIALTVAAIPEGLATVVTVVLAIGVEKMVKEKAIVKKLPAVETLGCASIICSDKTGTLTQNKMTVTTIYHQKLKDVTDVLTKEEEKTLTYFSLCVDARIEEKEGVKKEIGDPTEIALINACNNYVKTKEFILKNRVKDLPFDSDRKMMSVLYEENGKYILITKGAPDIILEKSVNKLENLNAFSANEEMAHKALRVLAVAYREFLEMPEDFSPDTMENNLTFLGLVGMIDPARPEVKDSIAIAKKAGIKTVMITGDHVATAKAIAAELNILGENDLAISSAELHKMSDEELFNNIEKYAVYARVAPEDKVRIVEAWQKKGYVVAMTGDGVNDSPALKKADIGCAMGITGTDVSKEASDVVLVDDNFQTIVSAVRQGRGIYDNIKKVVKYLLSSNIGEVLTIFLASLISAIFKDINFGIPLLAIHLLWVNLITDTLPAFALGTEDAADDVMLQKPRPKNESFFANGLGITIAWQGVMIGLLALSAYMIGHFAEPNTDLGHTMAFMTLATSQLFHAFNMKSEHSIFNRHLFKNKYLIASFIIGLGLQLLICYIPPIATLFKVVRLEAKYLLICLGLAFSTIIIVEISKLFNTLIEKNKNKNKQK